MAVKFYLATWSGCLDYLEKGYPHKNVCIKTYWFKVFVGNISIENQLQTQGSIH